MDKKNLYKQIKEMIYRDADKAEEMLFDADAKKLLDNNNVVSLIIAFHTSHIIVSVLLLFASVLMIFEGLPKYD